ncbi:MAG TPA: aldo/keto reductase [Armatimonadota bacterium]|jgi:aryl-alcohol dehydrogenase-like predicted oxidoreductase
MRIRRFGNTDLTASEVGFGLWTLTTGWWGDRSEDEAIALVRKAYDLGVTFFDTADTYGEGYGETFLATALGAHRDDITIATKFGYDFYNNTERRGQQERPHDWSPKFVRFALEQSLMRLNTDHIDLWQLHNARLDAAHNDELWETLDAIVQEGKVRYIGAAMGPANGWLEDGLAFLQMRPITAIHIIYNILEQHPGEDFLLHCPDTCGAMVRVPHSSGMLEGHYTAETTFPPNDHRLHRPKWWLTEGIKKVETLRFLEQEHDLTMAQASIKWLLAHPRITTVLPNIYDEAQLVEFTEAPAREDLSPADLVRIRDLYRQDFCASQA